MSRENSFFGWLFAFVLLMVGMAASIALRGWVIAEVWSWHVHPSLSSVTLTYAQGVGLTCLGQLLVYVPRAVWKSPEQRREEGDRTANATFFAGIGELGGVCLVWLFLWFVAWLAAGSP